MAERRRALAESLVARRLELGISQTELAARMGTSQSAVARIESGDADVRLSTLERYLVTGIEHIFLVGSHTHHGPVIELDKWPTPATSYVRDLEKRLTDVICEAAGKLQPARLAR